MAGEQGDCAGMEAKDGGQDQGIVARFSEASATSGCTLKWGRWPELDKKSCFDLSKKSFFCIFCY